MTEHELCYRMGPVRMPHLVNARVGGLSYFYCTCGQWRNMRKPDTYITVTQMKTIVLRHKKHVKESGE